MVASLYPPQRSEGRGSILPEPCLKHAERCAALSAQNPSTQHYVEQFKGLCTKMLAGNTRNMMSKNRHINVNSPMTRHEVPSCRTETVNRSGHADPTRRGSHCEGQIWICCMSNFSRPLKNVPCFGIEDRTDPGRSHLQTTRMCLSSRVQMDVSVNQALRRRLAARGTALRRWQFLFLMSTVAWRSYLSLLRQVQVSEAQDTSPSEEQNTSLSPSTRSWQHSK
ncbi:uncharacterized [Tachysurus ichikawai]